MKPRRPTQTRSGVAGGDGSLAVVAAMAAAHGILLCAFRPGRTFVDDASVGIYGDAVSRLACRDAKVRTLLGTAAEVMGPGAEAPALDQVDDLGARAA